MRMFSPSRLLPLLAAFCVANANSGDAYVQIPGGTFKSALSYDDIKAASNQTLAKSALLTGKTVTPGSVRVRPFKLMTRPVTNAEFLLFVRQNATWQRDQIPTVFAESRYLAHWATGLSLGSHAMPEQPVVNVSWFAASAYCESTGARLPNWIEWEYAAAADETRADARSDPAWRARILGWYSKPSNQALATVGETPANLFGVQDLHGLVWEWPGDYAAMLVSSDNRAQNEQDRLKFCGAGAIAMDDRENYAVLMRIAMLSSLAAQNVTSNMGFRCARDVSIATLLNHTGDKK